jgi:hypothetical protein
VFPGSASSIEHVRGDGVRDHVHIANLAAVVGLELFASQVNVIQSAKHDLLRIQEPTAFTIELTSPAAALKYTDYV